MIEAMPLVGGALGFRILPTALDSRTCSVGDGLALVVQAVLVRTGLEEGAILLSVLQSRKVLRGNAKAKATRSISPTVGQFQTHIRSKCPD